MTEQFHNMPLEEMRERAELAERIAKATGQTEPTPSQRPAGMLVDRPEGLYISRRAARRGLTLGGVAAVIGTSVLAGAVLFGGDKNPNTTGDNSTPAGETQKPGKTQEPSSTAETGGFTPKETDTEHGFQAAKVDLSEFGGPKEFQADRLDYQPSDDENNPNEIPLMGGAVIDGDSNLDGVWTTDSNAQTGSRILNQKDGAVLDSKYGLTIYENYDPKYTDMLMKAIEKNQLSGGCGLVDGCDQSIAQVYTADGTLVPYTGMDDVDYTNTPSPSASTGIGECPAPTAEPPLCPTPTPVCPVPTETPSAECIPGYDNDLPNIYNGNLDALKKAVANNPDKVIGQNNFGEDVFPKDYVEVVNPGERVAIQGDVLVLQNGKLVKKFDNDGSTGAVTYISIPEDGNKVTVYMIYGGDVHRLAECTSEEEAKQLVDGYVNGMNVTYNGKVTEYDVK